jgi:Ca2+-binding RTX toxin-like protein
MTINPFSPILDTAVGNVIQVLSNSTVAPPSAGTIAFSNSQFSVNENGIPVTQVTLTRTGGSTGAVSATLNLSNGTATAGNDYIQTPITVIFADGETSKTVNLTQASQGLSFDGIDDWVDNPATFSDVKDTFTVEFWVNPTATRQANPESSSGVDAYFNQRYAIYPKQGLGTLGTFNDVYAGVSVGTNGITISEHTANHLPSVLVSDIPLSGWNHVALVYKNKTPNLYVNGQFIKTGLTSNYIVHPSNRFGSGFVDNEKTDLSFQGSMDDVRIWNKARTQAEIQADFNKELTGNETGLVGYWNFNSINGNTVQDLSSNNNDGTLVGAQSTTGIVPTSLIINDKTYEGNETLNLTLTNPTGGVTLGSQKTATLTIVDSEKILFAENFDNGASSLWSNSNWQVNQGTYSSPTSSINLLPYSLQDFTLELDINKVQNGGIFLRSDDASNNGVLLVTGGLGGAGTGFYWHIIQNGVYSEILSPSASGLLQSGISNVHLRIEVYGNNYSVFLNNDPTPVTTLNTGLFLSGKIGIVDDLFNQTFDNVKIAVEEYIFTGTANTDNLIGTVNNDTIIGLAGNDKLDGKAGSDNLQGGTGNDTYTIDNLGDIVTENLNEGTDTVRSYITYTLGNNLENLTLLGGSNLSGTGNELNNTLLGNNGNNNLIGGAGNDILDGQAGNDIMQGGLGNDTYTLSSAGDVVTENANEGTDTVKTYLTYTLGNNLENLTLLGNADIDGTGNSLNNSLTGNNFNNTLSGGDGNDTLNGTIGNDTLIGGNGTDTAYYYNATDSVIVNLATGIANDGQDGIDTLSQIENVQGSNTAGDNLTGNTGVNVLYGYGGADILTGGGGNDLLYLGSDTVKDTVNYTSGDGVDTVYNFVRGASGDLLKFTGITAIDIQVSGTSTLFKVGDGISSNTGFGSGTLLLTTSATTGFVAADVNVNLLGATFAFS